MPMTAKKRAKIKIRRDRAKKAAGDYWVGKNQGRVTAAAERDSMRHGLRKPGASGPGETL